ncbi:MAG: hypothetical protein ACRDAI_03460, partial [Candidatus Rhabdochlamydia sp.]
TLIPRMIVTSETTTLALENLNRILEVAGENIASASAFVVKAAKIGAGFTAVKFCTDIGLTCYQTAILKKLSDNTIKTEDEVVNVLKNTSGDLKSSAGQFTEDVHKMGQNFGHMSAEIASSANKASQNFGHMTESVSQASVEIAGSANKANQNFGFMTQDFHQASLCFMVTCLSLTTSSLVALTAYVTYLQESSCDRDKESMLCTVPLKSMAAAAIVTGVVAIKMLMPNSVQAQINDDFLIPEDGINKNVEWTQEELDSIEGINFDVFSFIETKRKLDDKKWEKQEMEWLLSQDKNIFLKVLLSDGLDDNN